MRAITGSGELAREVCQLLGGSAFGMGALSVSFLNDTDRYRLGGGHFIAKVSAEVTAKGNCDRGQLLAILDRAAVNGTAYSSGEGLMRVIPEGSAYLKSCDERGLCVMGQRYSVVWLGRS